ncbi:MAG TPA: DUF4915 domain-containing protein, partial [Tepidisphaeraceae bacterium]|nr:DUF4915 domain-containing protein [Tepidisphaeraceae bacterium]
MADHTTESSSTVPPSTTPEIARESAAGAAPPPPAHRPPGGGGPGGAPGEKKPDQPWLEVSASRHFSGWLHEQKISIAFTTYQAGKVLLLGVNPDGRLSIFERTFSRCMGLWADNRNGKTMWLSSLYQIWKLEDSLT